MASSEAGKAEPLVSAQNFGARLGLWRLRAELALDAGHTSEAVRLAKEIRDLYQRLGILEPCWVPWADTAMVAFLRAGLLDEAQALVEHLDMVTEGLPCRWPRSVAALGRAGLAEARGRLGRSRTPPPPSRTRLGRGGVTAPESPGPAHLRAFPAPQPPASARPGAPVRGDRRERGLWRRPVRRPGTDRAQGKWWAAAPAKFEGIERSGAERDRSGHRRRYQRGDRKPVVLIRENR